MEYIGYDRRKIKRRKKDNEQLIEIQLRGLEKQKQIIEKAVEYIGEYKDYCDKEVCDCTPEYFEDLLNILNGRSDE